MAVTISKALDPAAVARTPSQARARQRFEAIIQEAETLLLEGGLSGFSIPVLAERLGYTRGSVYVYFPTPYAVLNELAGRYLAELEAFYFDRAAELAGLNWRDAVRMVVDEAVRYYNDHPVAALLILGGAATDEAYRAQEMTIKRLGGLARQVYETKGLVIPDDPDVATLATDLAVACFRRSVFEHGRITAAYQDAAVLAMQSFLAHYLFSDAESVIN